jgi:hypothetical protein
MRVKPVISIVAAGGAGRAIQSGKALPFATSLAEPDCEPWLAKRYRLRPDHLPACLSDPDHYHRSGTNRLDYDWKLHVRPDSLAG